MARRARSARGEVVDFDLISIKSQIEGAPKAIEVSTRREYIDNKEGGNKKRKLIAEPAAAVAPAVEDFENTNAADDIPESVVAAKAESDAPAGDDFLIPVVTDDDDVAAIEASVNQPKKKVAKKRTSTKKAS